MNATHDTPDQFGLKTSRKLRAAFKIEVARLQQVFDDKPELIGAPRKMTQVNVINGLIAAYLEERDIPKRNDLAVAAVRLCGKWRIPEGRVIPEDASRSGRRTRRPRAAGGAILVREDEAESPDITPEPNDTPRRVK